MSKNRTKVNDKSSDTFHNNIEEINSKISFINIIGKIPKELNFEFKTKIPELCVFGDQSSGKSTFLNKLIGVDILPTGTGTVTKTPIEITIKKGLINTYKLVKLSNDKKNEKEYTFTDPTSVRKKLEDLFGKDITNPTDQIQLQVTIESTSCNVELKFTDLPGLMSTTDVTLPKLYDKYIVRDNVIIMFIRPSNNNDLALQPLLNMYVQEHLKNNFETIINKKKEKCIRIFDILTKHDDEKVPIKENVIKFLSDPAKIKTIKTIKQYRVGNLHENGVEVVVDEEGHPNLKISDILNYLSETMNAQYMNDKQEIIKNLSDLRDNKTAELSKLTEELSIRPDDKIQRVIELTIENMKSLFDGQEICINEDNKCNKYHVNDIISLMSTFTCNMMNIENDFDKKGNDQTSNDIARQIGRDRTINFQKALIGILQKEFDKLEKCVDTFLDDMYNTFIDLVEKFIQNNAKNSEIYLFVSKVFKDEMESSKISGNHEVRKVVRAVMDSERESINFQDREFQRIITSQSIEFSNRPVNYMSVYFNLVKVRSSELIPKIADHIIITGIQKCFENIRTKFKNPAYDTNRENIENSCNIQEKEQQMTTLRKCINDINTVITELRQWGKKR